MDTEQSKEQRGYISKLQFATTDEAADEVVKNALFSVSMKFQDPKLEARVSLWLA